MTNDDTPHGVTSVYQYFDAKGFVLYVGVTARNIRRTQEHAESKDWWPFCVGASIEHYATRDLALQREAQLIKRYLPPFNTVHNNKKDAARREYARFAPTPKVVGLKPVDDTVDDSVDDLKEARRRWYALSADEKRVAPCVRCGERPSFHGPECGSCRPRRSNVAKGKAA